MKHPRNVRDAVPANLTRNQVTAFADKVAHGLDYRAGDPLLPVFEKLGGENRNVASVFGRYGDKVFVDSMGSFAYEGTEWPEYDVSGLAEAMGAYFMHYPLTRSRYGEDVRMGVARYGTDPERDVVVREMIWFGAALTMPAKAFLEAAAEGMDAQALSRRFRVAPRTALGRMRSLGLVPVPA